MSHPWCFSIAAAPSTRGDQPAANSSASTMSIAARRTGCDTAPAYGRVGRARQGAPALGRALSVRRCSFLGVRPLLFVLGSEQAAAPPPAQVSLHAWAFEEVGVHR